MVIDICWFMIIGLLLRLVVVIWFLGCFAGVCFDVCACGWIGWVYFISDIGVILFSFDFCFSYYYFGLY